jgi:hypothetical protein
MPVDAIMNIVSAESKFNDDGFSFYAVVDNEEVVVRTLDENRFVSELRGVLDEDPFLLHLHLRAASSGAISEENVHMWRIADNANYYYVSHNGFVGRFSSVYRYSSTTCNIYGSYVYQHNVYQHNQGLGDASKDAAPAVSTLSDTRQMVDQQEFREALLKKDLKRLSSILTDYGFYGVLFATNPREIVAVSKNKSIKVLAYSDILFMSNNDISKFFGDVVEIFGFRLFAKHPHSEIEDTIIVYDLENMKVVASEPTRYLYISSANASQKTSFFLDKKDEEKAEKAVEEDEEEEDEAVEEDEEIDIWDYLYDDDEFYDDRRRFKWLWRSRGVEI